MGDQSDDQLLKELEVGYASFDVLEMAQIGPERPQSGIRGLKSSRLQNPQGACTPRSSLGPDKSGRKRM